MSDYLIDEELQQFRSAVDGAAAVPRRIGLVLMAIDRILWVVSLATAGLILCAMVVIVFAGTAFRWLDVPIVLAHQEIAGYMLAGLAFLGLTAGFKEGFPRVTVLYDRYPARLRVNMDLILLSTAVVYSGVLAYYAWRLVVDSRDRGIITSGVLTQPLWVLQTTMAVGLTLFTLYLANSVGLRVVRRVGKCDQGDQ